MEIKYFQKGFNYSQDGPGNRLVIHLQGCNLHCPWCSNPEGMDFNSGIVTDTDNLFKEILSCKRLFFDGGGVTFTGGECTMQKQALLSLLKKCKKNQIHTAIETNSTCPFDNELFSFVDLIICDFKHHNEQILKETVGNVFEYKKNIIDYVSSKKQVLIRTVLIKGFNSSKNDAEEFAKFFANLHFFFL